MTDHPPATGEPAFRDPEFPAESRKHYSLRRIATETWEVLLGERGISYTAINLFLRPKESMTTILSGAPHRFNDPVKFVVLSVALAVITMNLFDPRASMHSFFPDLDFIAQANRELEGLVGELEELERQPDLNRETAFRVERSLTALRTSHFEWFMGILSQWFNVAFLLTVPVYAVASRLIFPSNLNLAEHLVINSYIFGVQSLLSVIVGVLGIWSYSLYSIVFLIISLFYQVWAFWQIFQFRSLADWLRCAVLIAINIVAGCVVFAIYFIGGLILVEQFR